MIYSFTNPAPRRVVLLGDGDHGAIERVLCDVSAEDAKGEMRRQAVMNPGRRVAIEWKSEQGWVRFWWADERRSIS